MLGYEIKQEVSKQLGGYPIDWHGQSAAVVGSQIFLPVIDDDLDYPEDSGCDTDMNVVMTGAGGFVEVQGTAEGEPFARSQMDSLLGLAERGIRELILRQRQALDLR